MTIEDYGVDPPGTFIRQELEARQWSQRDLAYVLGMAEAQLSRILSGAHAITPEMAKQLGDAFDVRPDFFVNLQKQYDLARAKEPDPGIKKRAALQGQVPLREMIRRGWIEDGSPSMLALQVSRFLEAGGMNGEAPRFAAKRTNYAEDSPSQLAWLYRVRQLARFMNVAPYDKARLEAALGELKARLIDPELVREVPEILASAGVRLVFVEPLPNAKIDGVCTWLSDEEPVIALSLRYDRLDNFWFVLRHEIEHVLRGDGRDVAIIDDFDVEQGDSLPPEEQAANAAAQEFCLPAARLTSFIERKFPYISERDVISFAAVSEVHPAIVVGQVQRKIGKYNFLRKYLVPVRKFLMSEGLVDGWGNVVPSDL